MTVGCSGQLALSSSHSRRLETRLIAFTFSSLVVVGARSDIVCNFETSSHFSENFVFVIFLFRFP